MSPQVESVQRSPAFWLGLDAGNRGQQGPRSSTPGQRHAETSRRILLVEDDPGALDSVKTILEDEGYRVTCAENGWEALELLRAGGPPDVIVLDLRMPIMDGWEFRALQKRYPHLAEIPVVAVSSDGSARAAAIDADAYLRKPLNADSLLATIEHILAPAENQVLGECPGDGPSESALSRFAAILGQEINDPLAYLMVNVDVVTKELDRISGRSARVDPDVEREELDHASELLRECRQELDRIGDVVSNLQILARPGATTPRPFSMNDLLDRAIAMSRHKTDGRATIVRRYGELPRVFGEPSALGQLFLNLLCDAAEALAEGDASENQIVVCSGVRGPEVIVEISGSGVLTPKPSAAPDPRSERFSVAGLSQLGPGLALSVSLRIVTDHGGRIETFNDWERGATFRVVLPIDREHEAAPPLDEAPPAIGSGLLGRVLVIDDEPFVGQTIRDALADQYEVIAVSLATEAFSRLAAGEIFDVILCDVLMPEMGGRDVYDRLRCHWPNAARDVVFMMSGSFTLDASELLNRTARRVLFKPLRPDELRAAVREQMDEHLRRLN